MFQKYGFDKGFTIVSFAIAQACLESGYGTSSAAKNKNNILGIGPGKKFSSIEKCVEAYYTDTVLGKSKDAKNAKTLDDYYDAFVKSGYLGGTGQQTYYKNIKSIISSYNINQYNKGKAKGEIFEPWPKEQAMTVKTEKYGGWFGSKNPYQVASYGKHGNCVWFAYGRFCMIANKWVKRTGDEDAWGFWKSSSGAWGMPTCEHGQSPKLGAIAVWSAPGGGRAGHVAVVEHIYDNGDILVSESGYGNGWLGVNKLTQSSGYTNGRTGWCGKLRGFIYNPKEFAANGVYSGGTGTPDGEGSGTGQAIDMKQRIAVLYSSDNYEFVVSGDKKAEDSPTKKFRDAITESVKKIQQDYQAKYEEQAAVNEQFLSKLFSMIADAIKSLTREKIKVLTKTTSRKRNSFFDISRYLVEAPFIELNIGGYKIGGYRGSLDLYPNYISGMTISKASGSINEYTIYLVHQVRVGDDPNALDKVFSTNQFNKITISYGDAMTGRKFKDTNAIIQNVAMNRDYASAKILYTISATSAGHFVTSHAMNFEALNGKPSDRIRKLLYNSSISKELQDAFPAMRDKTRASSLIPNNDAPIHIDKVTNTDPITYINYLVGCMSNAKDKDKIIKDSVYFIYYTDDGKRGAGFEIKEVKRDSISSNYNAVYEVTVGYPDDNNIFGFQITNDMNWSIMYDTHMSSTQDEYYYTIESNGNTKKIYSPALTQSTQEMQEHDKNWWTFMTQFPITASLSMRGLLRPAFLTNYIKINTVFYGQKHISSGLYMILEQQDTIDGNGFRTNFSLVRVGDK